MGRRSADQVLNASHLEELKDLYERGRTANGVVLSEKTKENLKKLIGQYRQILEEKTVVDS